MTSVDRQLIAWLCEIAQFTMTMDEREFWQLIDQSREAAGTDVYRRDERRFVRLFRE